jgi:hypothetical protein
MILKNHSEELKPFQLLEMFHVEELEGRFEMCWINCPLPTDPPLPPLPDGNPDIVPCGSDCQ